MTPTTETYTLSVEYGATPSSMVVVPAADRTEFENFEELASRLLKLPKDSSDSHRD
jgi:hypothetical protein